MRAPELRSDRGETARLEYATLRRAHYLVVPRHRLRAAQARLHDIAPAESHNTPVRRVENKATLASLRQAKPAFVTPPRNRAALSQTIRNSRQRLPPPGWLSNRPAKPSLACILKLRESAVKRHTWRIQKWAPQKHAPEFVPSMTMMIRHFAANSAGVVMTNCHDWREKHVVSSSYALQRVVRLLVHVEEFRLKSR